MIRTALIAVAAAALVAPAFAQQPPQPPRPTPAERAAEFEKADVNKDDFLTKEEWVAIVPESARPRIDAVWGRMDPDHTGKVSKTAYVNFDGTPAGLGTAHQKTQTGH